MVKLPAVLPIPEVSPHANLISKAISGISDEGSGWLLEKFKTVVLILSICMGSNMRILTMKFCKA